MGSKFFKIQTYFSKIFICPLQVVAITSNYNFFAVAHSFIKCMFKGNLMNNLFEVPVKLCVFTFNVFSCVVYFSHRSHTK